MHASPSSQRFTFATNLHSPVPASQTSLVHGLPSPHDLAGPATHTPLWQVSPTVHALSSVHGTPLTPTENTQVPVAPSQVSEVQGSPSSQTTGSLWQRPPLQVSFWLHLFPSSHAWPSRALVSVVHSPLPGSHERTVQGLPSSQSFGAPPEQPPSRQMAPTMQRSSATQETSSSFGTASATHSPPLQTGAAVHGLSSSSQSSGCPAQTPSEQVSLVVHGLPSEQTTPSGSTTYTHPAAASHVSCVQVSPSSQSVATPPPQAPSG